MMKHYKVCLSSLAALALASCEEAQETPATQIYVLVDLSKTWAAPGREKRNEATLKEVGEGIADASADLETPISVQYRVIGADNLEADPLCDVLLKPKLAPMRAKANYEVSNRSDFRSYLATDCVTYIQKQPPEPLTAIRTAVASVANQPAAGARRREIIIVSDFLEETMTPIVLDSDLSSFHTTLVYRPVAQDLDDPTALRFRLDSWKAELKARGTRVDALPDTGIRRSIIAAYLKQGLKS
jgi:hypothetical protein